MSQFSETLSDWLGSAHTLETGPEDAGIKIQGDLRT